MKITILGAAGGEVTGSSYLVETKSAAVLVDCGFFQGARKLENYNRVPRKSGMNRLNAVVLTHAHLDHTGRLPLLTKAMRTRQTECSREAAFAFVMDLVALRIPALPCAPLDGYICAI